MRNQPHARGSANGLFVTVFDSQKAPYTLSLDAFGKDSITFGRGPNNDIRLESEIASGHPHHGRLVRANGSWRIEDLNSTNGLICNNSRIQKRIVQDGDLIRIDGRHTQNKASVLFVFASEQGQKTWRRQGLQPTVTIGRSPDCNIVLPYVNVSRNHARISLKNSRWILEDNHSTNGVILNNQQVHGSAVLREKDVIAITGNRIIFCGSGIYYHGEVKGISLDVSNVVIRRGQLVTGNHISAAIKPGELIAIIGGSGAGKSTILNCMCGYLPPSEGHVYINGTDLYQNFDALKKTYGYVPQADIVYDNLTLWDMLDYTAKLRLPQDTSQAEREAAIKRAIKTVDLEDRKNHLIRKLSGGQRKRASIAVELLSDPKLLFLDEPASGLDPGTERNLMQALRAMANQGKTVILVTHSTLQLQLCDKIMFMGKGGNLCFFGNYHESLRFFGVRDIVDVYEPLTKHAPELKARYEAMTPGLVASAPASMPKPIRSSFFRQLGPLCSRYLKLVSNDRQRLFLLLIQAPLLAILISFVADGEQFKQYEMTKSLLFALSCSAFWIGMLNAIQEICKERTILKREYMTGLSLEAYLSSKMLVLGLMCLIQSVMVTGVFALLVGSPDKGVVAGPYAEMLLVCFLTAISSAATGLFVSSLFTNADRAMTVAPILLMPQILFSGLIFNLEGIAKSLSWFAVCRWSMEGFGTTADLNRLPNRMELQEIPVPRVAEDFFTYSPEHFWKACLILLGYTIVFLLLSRLALQKLSKETA